MQKIILAISQPNLTLISQTDSLRISFSTNTALLKDRYFFFFKVVTVYFSPQYLNDCCVWNDLFYSPPLKTRQKEIEGHGTDFYTSHVKNVS